MIDYNTQAWKEIEVMLQFKLQRLREENDANKDELQTAKIRGKIELIKELIVLPKKADRQVIDEDLY